MENENFMESHSLSSQNATNTVAIQQYTALDVANAFVDQYYKVMQNIPGDAHNFYKDQSVRTHPCVDGSMKSVTTKKDICDGIMASNIKKWNPDMESVHAQDSLMESVLLKLTGSVIDNDGVAKNFAQTFLLAPQEGGGFYVHNDIIQFIEIKVSETSPSLEVVADPPAAHEANDTAKDSALETAQATNKDQTEKFTSTKEDVDTKIKVSESFNKDQTEKFTSTKEDVDTKIKVSESFNKDETEKSTSTKEDVDTKIKVSESLEGKDPLPTESKKKSQPTVQSAPNTQDSKKESYASILAKEGSGLSTAQLSPNAVGKVSPNSEKRASTSPVGPKPSAHHVKSTTIPKNGPLENIYDVKAIRVKDLPPKMTQESLLEVVKKFGPVKLKNIQIKEYSQDGYRYAFVEFDNPKSAHTAVEARFIRLEERVCEIQYKKISNQGGNNHMGRPPQGRVGNRNENFWGREGEGRSNGNWGNKHNDHENSGQTREYNHRRNRYSQDRP